MKTLGRQIVNTSPFRLRGRVGSSWKISSEHSSAPFSTFASHVSFSGCNRDDEERSTPTTTTRQLPRVQTRSFHATPTRDFAPFLPEIIVGIGLGAGWVIYRTSQGKPLTPDQALASQEAYRKMQDDLRRRNKKYDKQSENDQEPDRA